jgi:hypothetical protein
MKDTYDRRLRINIFFINFRKNEPGSAGSDSAGQSADGSSAAAAVVVR